MASLLSADVNNACSYTATPCLHGVVLKQALENVTFIFPPTSWKLYEYRALSMVTVIYNIYIYIIYIYYNLSICTIGPCCGL
jgi:hypothetical protein